MKVNVQAVNFNIDKKLVEFINVKASKLEKFFDRIISCNVSLKTENGSDKENKTADFVILVPGDEFVVKKTCKTFEEAVDLCEEAAERMLLKYKEKSQIH